MHSPSSRTLALSLIHLALALFLLALFVSSFPLPVRAAAPTDLFFSEYVEGSSNNKALEIYNGTGAAIDLAAGGYSVQMFFNGSFTATLTINLVGTVANGDVFVLAQSSASAAILAQADQTNGSGWFNGNDAVVLRKGTTIIDAIGQIGFNPGTEWGSGLISTADNTLRRKGSVTGGSSNGMNTFNPFYEWNGFPMDTFTGLGRHSLGDDAPSVRGTAPDGGATGIDQKSNVTVNFSEAVNVSGTWFTLTCSKSGNHSAAVTGDGYSFTLDPSTDFAPGDACTLRVLASQVSDQDSNDPPNNMNEDFVTSFTTFDACALTYTPIYEIQGSGMSAAKTGSVTTQGVVVGDYEGASSLNGFYLQDQNGDGNANTSDGLFVYNPSQNSVSLGDVVRVAGTVGENQEQTQISSVSSLIKCGTASLNPVDVTLPLLTADSLERFEGMLVRLPQTLYVTEHYQLGRYGQIVMSSGGREKQPTSVVAPGVPAQNMQAANNLNRIIIDDASNTQNPDPIVFGRGGSPLSASNTLRGGDTATGIVGILGQYAGAYRVRPLNAIGGAAPNFAAANPRPTAPASVGGTLKVASMNLLNYYNTFTGCTNGVGGSATDCRGANSQTEFDRQWPKTIAAILGTGADIIGVNEIENDGYGANSAIQDLVNKLNAAAGPNTFAFINADAQTGQVNALGTDGIKIGLIYRPTRVTPVGKTAALNTPNFVNGGDSAPRNRPSLAQAFQQNATGARLVVDVNHLKSKGSACDAPDAGDGQGNCNLVRRQAAQALVAWLATNPTGTGDPDVLIIGDLNSYAMEDPVSVIKNAGYTNLVDKYLSADAYSYVFDGQWGYLDHALGSATLARQVTGVTEYHINADEPSVLDYNVEYKTANLQTTLYAPDQYRISDHDPVIVGLNLDGTPPALNVTVSPNNLWPANHKVVTVKTTVSVSDNNDPNPTWGFVSVQSNEPDNGLGDGDQPNDIVTVNSTTFQLRAERSGTGTGRQYTITYSAADMYGNSTTKSVLVTVPRDQK